MGDGETGPPCQPVIACECGSSWLRLAEQLRCCSKNVLLAGTALLALGQLDKNASCPYIAEVSAQPRRYEIALTVSGVRTLLGGVQQGLSHPHENTLREGLIRPAWKATRIDDVMNCPTWSLFKEPGNDPAR